MGNDIPSWLYPFEHQCGDTNDKDRLVSDYMLKTIWYEQFPCAIPVPYVPGKISYTEVPHEKWAISSKFSGCKMALFYSKGEQGRRYVCHLAINDRAYRYENKEAFEKDERIQKHYM